MSSSSLCPIPTKWRENLFLGLLDKRCLTPGGFWGASQIPCTCLNASLAVSWRWKWRHFRNWGVLFGEMGCTSLASCISFTWWLINHCIHLRIRSALRFYWVHCLPLAIDRTCLLENWGFWNLNHTFGMHITVSQQTTFHCCRTWRSDAKSILFESFLLVNKSKLCFGFLDFWILFRIHEVLFWWNTRQHCIICLIFVFVGE